MPAHTRADEHLKECYERNGCLRVRRDDPAKGRYGGVELRLVVVDVQERKEVKAALKSLDIIHGKTYRKETKRRQWVVPIYSRADILSFLRIVRPKGYMKLVREVGSVAKRRPIKTRRKRPAVRQGSSSH